MSNPNKNPVTNALSANDLMRIVQEGYSGDISLAQLAAQFGGGGAFGVKSVGLLGQSAVPSSVTGSTAQTVLATVPIPAGALGINGAIRVTTLWSFTNNANNKTPGVSLGATQVFGPVIASQASMQGVAFLRNRGVLNSQVANALGAGSVGSGSSTLAVGTFAIDTSVAQNLTITGQLATSTDTMTLEGYTVEVLNP